MHRCLLLLAFTVCLPSLGFAQQVPAIDTSMPLGSSSSLPKSSLKVKALNSIYHTQGKLNAKEQKGVHLADEWKNKADLPIRGEDGSVVFPFGATLPSVVCAPLYASDLRLQPGEIVNQVDVGDAVRWKVTPAMSGNGQTATTHLIIKPVESGLTTNLIINTDRRCYNVKLVSRIKDWMPSVSFSYPEETQEQWKSYRQQYLTSSNLLSAEQNVTHLDFGYQLKGDSPRWKPIRVYTDNVKTYIQFPTTVKNAELPALVVLGGDNKEQLVNYRVLDDRYVVDKVVQRAALISGVGHRQDRVDIIREGS